MSIYQFKEEDAHAFARHIGAKTRVKNGQLEFLHCPYCKSDDKQTFYISLTTGQFECKRASCRAKGNMITLSKDFEFSLGREVDTYYRTCNYSLKQYKEFKDAHRSIEVRDAAIEYLKGRGIPEDIIRKYEITTKLDAENIIVFPFKDEAGDLTFVKYRNSTYQKGDKGHKEWCEADRKPILFGMNNCDPEADDGQLIITEGQIDTLSVVTAGFTNVVSVPTGANGFTWIPHCYDFMQKFKTIVVMGDCEKGKITLSEEIARRWTKNTKVCREEDYKGLKDANDILQKFGVLAIKEAIKNAEPVSLQHIKPLAMVEQVDIMAMPTIKTTISELDQILDGGFRFGMLTVLTGKRGEGKSTLASQIGIEAIEQGYNAFFYSGELPDHVFRNWMDCQVTGKLNHTRSENDRLNMWYGKRAFIFDNTIIDEDEMVKLLEVIETAILQKDCRFIVLDNLMTAMDDDVTLDLYRSQGRFVGQLAALTKKYNVCTILISHPRKTQNGLLENDDISGSSQITDRADYVLQFGRNKDEENECFIRLTKNRLTGKITKTDSAVRCVYDPNSRRIAGSNTELKEIHYCWNALDDSFESINDMETIPF